MPCLTTICHPACRSAGHSTSLPAIEHDMQCALFLPPPKFPAAFASHLPATLYVMLHMMC